MDVVEEGIRRTTFPLPFGLDHVHCYLLRTASGWTLVDTGLGVPDPAERWQPLLDELDAPLERIVVTHMHPDHVGGAADVAAVSGAPVLQGRADYEQCVSAWGNRDSQRFVDYWVSHGMPAEEVAGIARESERLATPCTGCATRNCSTRATRSTAGASRCCPGTPTATSCSCATG